MSDEWVFYPCTMGECTASIFYDHGIRETIGQVTQPRLLKVRIAFKHPRPDGLSSREEYQQLCNLEDAVTEMAQSHGGIHVGRVTVAKHRYLHIFAPGTEDEWGLRLKVVGEKHGYELGFVLKPDPDREGYWQDLFPTEDDWQVVMDLRVLEALAKRGDDHGQKRQIDHWAYFTSQPAAEVFAGWVRAQGYRVISVEPDDRGEYRVRFSHEGIMQLSDITSHTVPLRRKTRELGGNYDGWETPVSASQPGDR